MLRFVRVSFLICGILAFSVLSQSGCAPAPPPQPVPPPVSTPGPTIPGPPDTSSNATIPGPPTTEPNGTALVPFKGTALPQETANPIPPAETKRSEPAPGDTLELWGSTRAYWAKEMITVLDSVRDDASASAAANKLLGSGRQYADAVKQFNATMAAMSLSGQQDQVVKYLQQQAAASPEAELLTKIETAVNSPQGPILQPAINGLFDAWLQSATSGERRGIERVIEKQKLRR